MTDRETRIISEEILSEDGPKKEIIRVSVRYRKSNRNRGYYLDVQPMTIEKAEGARFYSESFLLFSGASRFIEAATRFSEKRLDQLAALAKNTLAATEPFNFPLAIGAMREQVLTAREEKAQPIAAHRRGVSWHDDRPAGELMAYGVSPEEAGS